MCNDSSIIFTQKCSHLYSNLESFLFCLYFFPALLLSFFVPTSTKPTATLRGDGRQSKRLVSIPVWAEWCLKKKIKKNPTRDGNDGSSRWRHTVHLWHRLCCGKIRHRIDEVSPSGENKQKNPSKITTSDSGCSELAKVCEVQLCGPTLASLSVARSRAGWHRPLGSPLAIKSNMNQHKKRKGGKKCNKLQKPVQAEGENNLAA